MDWQEASLRLSGKNFVRFNDVCESGEFDVGTTSYETHQRTKGNVLPEDRFNDFINEINQLLRDGDANQIIFNGVLPHAGKFVLSDSYDNKTYINVLQISPNDSPLGCELEFKGLKILSVIVALSASSKITDPIKFENCEIIKLTLNSDSRVYLKNCKVGTIEINKTHQIHMEGGCVLNIQVAAPGAPNPLTGSVIFSNTFVPRNRNKYLLPGAQPYRNMRHHLRAIENGHMANFFHSAELAVERADDGLLNKILSYGYEWLSDFGSSAVRPLLWWILLYLLAVYVVFHSHGAVRAFAMDDYYQGWRGVLISKTVWYTGLLKAGYLSFQSMINPLGLFRIRELIIPAYGWLVSFLSFIGLLSLVLITLFILAVRRRFKMNL